MFAKLAQSLGFGRRHAALSKAAPCNDNHPARPLATISRAPRRALVCGWRRAPVTGRLECFGKPCWSTQRWSKAPG